MESGIEYVNVRPCPVGASTATSAYLIIKIHQAGEPAYGVEYLTHLVLEGERSNYSYTTNKTDWKRSPGRPSDAP